MIEKATKLIAKARKTNAYRDKIERENGFGTPSDCGSDVLVRTALEALDCGMAMEDWNAVAEAYVMLEPLGRKLK